MRRFFRTPTICFLVPAGITLAVTSLTVNAQSTLARVNGAVRDNTGAAIPGAAITLHRNESNTERTVQSDASGNYTVLNIDPGTYRISATSVGFVKAVSNGVVVLARQQLQFDIKLAVSANETVQVNASDAGAIETDDAAIAASLTPRDVLDLPANYRGNGSTSPLNVIQTLPGIQPDSGSYPPAPSASPAPGIKFSIQGGLPSQSETTVDGISAQNQTTNNIQADAFPSAESIAEIRVDGVNNNAEYGQPGEITTITKTGTNHLHGSGFWYF